MEAKKFICFILCIGISSIIAILSSAFGISRSLSVVIGLIIFGVCSVYLLINEDK